MSLRYNDKIKWPKPHDIQLKNLRISPENSAERHGSRREHC